MLSAKSSPCDWILANYASIGSVLLEVEAFLMIGGVFVARIRMPRHCKTQLTLVLQQAGVERGPSPIHRPRVVEWLPRKSYAKEAHDIRDEVRSRRGIGLGQSVKGDFLKFCKKADLG